MIMFIMIKKVVNFAVNLMKQVRVGEVGYFNISHIWQVGKVQVIVNMIGLNVYSLYQDCATGSSPQYQRYQYDMKHVFPNLNNSKLQVFVITMLKSKYFREHWKIYAIYEYFIAVGFT